MLLKLGRDVAPYEIYQMIHILMLLWQHARFQSPASSNLNITGHLQLNKAKCLVLSKIYAISTFIGSHL